MKNLKYIPTIILLAAIMSTFSCSEEFLDFKPTGVVASEDLNNVDNVEKMIIAAYASLGNDGLLNHPYEDLWPLGTSRSDDGYKAGGGIGDVFCWHQTEIFTLNTPANSCGNLMWSNIYSGISRINDALRRVLAIDDATYQAGAGVPKAQRVAELRFIRGHFEFILKKIYKFPVFLDETVEKADVVNVGNRVHSDQEGWALIADEFRAGVANLPDVQDDEGRPTKNAARCYLAKVLMYKAYVQDDNHQVVSINQGELQEVISLIEAVEATGEYDLYDDFAKNFLWEFESGIESVWAIMRSINDGSPEAGRGSLSSGLTSSMGPGYGCCSFNHGSRNLANAFKTDANGLPVFDGFNEGPQIQTVDDLLANNIDPRLVHTIGIPGITWKYDENRIYDESYSRVPGVYGVFLGMKDQELPSCPCFRQYTAFFMTARNTDQIRWADVLLWKAEALIELGRMDEALPIINRIRARAISPESTSRINFNDGSPTGNWVVGEYTSLGSQDEARAILRKERRLELAFESHRFFDLVRWGITEEVMNEYFEVEKTRATHLVDGRFTAGRDEYMAIPESQITLSQGLYVQNPGYN